MKREEYDAHSRAADLREAFDRAFAVAPLETHEEGEQLLGIEVADDAYAVRVREILGVCAASKILPLPSAAHELLGVAAVRGAVLPIYGLGALLGYTASASAPRWLVVAAAGPDQQLGLAFDGVAGTRRVRPAELRSAAAARSHIREVACFADQSRPILSIPSVVDAVLARIGAARPSSHA